MNLEDLMLTEEEMEGFRYFLNREHYASPWRPKLYLQEVARAAVAKFAWGMVDDLKEYGDTDCTMAHQTYVQALEVAGIPRPEVKHDR